MANLPLDARVLLESGGLAHLVTLNPDGVVISMEGARDNELGLREYLVSGPG